MNITKAELERSLHRTSERALYSSLFSSINVALSCVAVLYISFSFFGFQPNIYVLVSGFMATFSIYLLNTVTDFKEDIINNPQKAELISHRKKIYIFFIVSYTTSLFVGYLVKPVCVLILLIPLLVGIFYSIEIKDFRLKNVFLGKNVSISFSWAMDASLFPFLFQKNIISFFAVFSFIFLKGMINTILFDLRDIRGDAIANIKTIPVVIGKKMTTLLLILLNSLLIIWLFFFFNVILPYLVIVLLCIAYGYIYILFFTLSKNPPSYLYSILVDDEWLWWMFLIMFIQML